MSPSPFAAAHKSADANLERRGMPADGQDPAEMAGPPQGGDPLSELQQLLGQLPPELAQQIMMLVEQVAGGAGGPQPGPPMAEPDVDDLA